MLKLIAFVSLCVSAIVGLAVAYAQDGAQVIKLRTQKIDLFDAPKGPKTGEYQRESFKGPWRVLSASKDGYTQVEIDGKRFWVRTFAIETDKVVRSTAECNVTIAQSNSPKASSTRGVGGECK